MLQAVGNIWAEAVNSIIWAIRIVLYHSSLEVVHSYLYLCTTAITVVLLECLFLCVFSTQNLNKYD